MAYQQQKRQRIKTRGRSPFPPIATDVRHLLHSLPDPERIIVNGPLAEPDPSEEAVETTALLVRDLAGHSLLILDDNAHPDATGRWHSWPYFVAEVHEIGGSLTTLTVLRAGNMRSAHERMPIGIGLPHNDGLRTLAQLSQTGQLPITCDTRFTTPEGLQCVYATLTDPGFTVPRSTT